MKLPLKDIQLNIVNIANRSEYDENIIYELLAAYGRSKSSITQLKNGQTNRTKDEKGSVLQKDIVYFKVFNNRASLEHEVLVMEDSYLSEKFAPRYIIATDLNNFAAKDVVKGTQISDKLANIDNHLEFFYSWTGGEIISVKNEAVADRRAADKMNQLYQQIEKDNRENFIENPNFRHQLNVFFTRLLFCFFAEDTEIYEKGQFTNSIKNYTKADGSDLSWFLGEVFKSLDTKDGEKSNLAAPFKDFPFVNGSIFNTSKHEIAIPEFGPNSRHLILECGSQNWSEINPDIFGVMFQGVVDPAHRGENGMDYTSVPNIMKVIEPLFLDKLNKEFEKYYNNEKKLWNLLNRIRNIKIFDPACGSGNFLIIAYKELRRLQHAIFARLNELSLTGFNSRISGDQLININNFYGIEIDDFAHELAILSLFLAKHQMNQEFMEQFGKKLSIIPLIDIPTIVKGNAARIDWHEVCPNYGHAPSRNVQTQTALLELDEEPNQQELNLYDKIYDEIYLIGNPPYKGSKLQTPDQKRDFQLFFEDEPYSKNLDYIALWFIKGARYISGTRAKLAFVSTNSVAQGEHAGIMFPKIFDEKVEIHFAYTSFKWKNSARDNAGVTVVIIGLSPQAESEKYLFIDEISKTVKNINAYLIESESSVIVEKVSKSISGFEDMVFGSQAIDKGFLTLNKDEKEKIEQLGGGKFIKDFIGSEELIKGLKRYCLWIEDKDLDEAIKNAEIAKRIENVKNERLKMKSKTSVLGAQKPWSFLSKRYNGKPALLVPRVSSERREYIPMAYVDENTVVPDSAQFIEDAPLFLFAVLESKMHMAWIRTVCGQLETRIRYSSTLGYNTFPLNLLTESEKVALNQSAREILLARARHPEKTLAEMYDPDKMPENLRQAHFRNDLLVDSLYRKAPFKNDEERLAVLFNLYEIATKREKE